MTARKEREHPRTALLHVADRTGVVEFAHALIGLGFELVATGPTSTALRHAGAPHKTVSEFVGERLPADALGLLHPKLIAAITDEKPRVDLVAVNLFPLSSATSDPALSQNEVLSYVDPVGPALLRAAARNFKRVIPLCDPDDYQQAVDTLKSYDRMLPDRRQTLAAKAFHYSAYYDSTVAQYLGGQWEEFPDEVVIALKKSADLRYGENPHQAGAFYTLSGARPWGLNAAKLHLGRPLVYGHYLDLETAWELVNAFHEPACAIVKHGVPAGFACDEDLAKAARSAYAGDPRGCFRGTAAVNVEVSAAAAEFFAEEFVSCIAAPEFSPKALQLLKAKKDIRLVTLPSKLISAHELDLRAVAGGMLVQERDQRPFVADLKTISRRQPTDREMRGLVVAWHTAMHARTHAAVIARGTAVIGIGSGQTSRLDSVRLAIVKSQERHPILAVGEPLVMASDGALTSEHVLAAADGGVTAVIHPGGASQDRNAAEAADARSVALVSTGVRHFKH
ncbi:MAG: bifunctional phosphoribosylaminoimidazolecarboxamide formyltransferase/IMP cyclohydrolase PurH [Elusimicrobia bacterium CG11_big_fil_rev_8_21_14_0_20_64_6]|nr:MAG: bifunctional phosphoribosylaminoimidazolecarboxamide formyltransferase/IMP cyclohydrolase PurH [Elusimicrobia bacterium CG11_big_fil_rev_8_21_14_0_20_64_6]